MCDPNDNFARARERRASVRRQHSIHHHHVALLLRKKRDFAARLRDQRERISGWKNDILIGPDGNLPTPWRALHSFCPVKEKLFQELSSLTWENLIIAARGTVQETKMSARLCGTLQPETSRAGGH
jgi:hypothetical protein